jgi:CBS-domain-containing membrane protein
LLTVSAIRWRRDRHEPCSAGSPNLSEEISDVAEGPKSVYIVQSVGSGVAIAGMGAFALRTGFPLMFVPFATSIVLVMGMPDADPAQPRALVGGHIISTMVGLAVLHFMGPGLWADAVGVALATGAMHFTRTFHPPAGIDPLVVLTGNAAPSFLFVPVMAGALLLALFAFVWHRIFRSGAWPKRWW